MTADEQQTQDVIAIMRAVEALGRRFLCVFEIGDRLVLRQWLLLRLRRTSSIATFRPTMISHAGGSRGGPFCGQLFSARRQAFWNASSAMSRLRKYRNSAPTAWGRAEVSAASIQAVSVISSYPRAETDRRDESRRRHRDWRRRDRAPHRPPRRDCYSRRCKTRAAA